MKEEYHLPLVEINGITTVSRREIFASCSDERKSGHTGGPTTVFCRNGRFRKEEVHVLKVREVEKYYPS